MKSIATFNQKVAENCDINIFRIISDSRGYPVTQIQALKKTWHIDR